MNKQPAAATGLRVGAVLRRALTLALPVASLAAAAEPVVYTLDPAHSFVTFEVLHFGTSTLRGRFGPLRGEVTLDRQARRGEVGLRIATAAVSTGVQALDERLRRPDLLNSENHPEAFFVARQFTFDGSRLSQVRGEFTLRGVSAALALHARRFDCRQLPGVQREVCGGDFEAELLRSAFGADFGLPLVGDRVRLLVQVEALAP